MNIRIGRNAKKIIAMLLIMAIVAISSGEIATPVFGTRVLGEVNQTTVGDEPQFDNSKDKMWYDQKDIRLDKESSKDFGIGFKATDVYTATFTVKTNGEVYVDFRGTTGRVYIGERQYCILGVENQKYVQEAGLAKAENGVKITIQSSGTKASVWMNGKKVVDDATLTTPEQLGGLKVTWTTMETVFTNVQIWADKAVEIYKDPSKEADVDEPKYDNAKHDLKFSKDKIEIAEKSKSNFGTTIAAGNTYYTQYTLKTQGDFYYNFRGDTGRIFIGATQYSILGVEDVKWVKAKGLAQGSDGVKVTVASEGDLVSVWFNGIKIAEKKQLSEKGMLGLPAVTWTTDKVVLENVKVWTIKGQDDTVTVPDSDEPKYNDKKDYKYDLNSVKGGTYKNGVVTLKEKSSSIFLSDLPYNASYYMTMKIKTDNAVNIQSRHKQEIFNMNKSGFSASSLGKAWQNKKISTLENGARVTFYSTGSEMTVWIDGEKVMSGKYKNKDCAAQPGIGWSFDSTVEVSDICIWTTKEYKSDKPTYNKKSDVLHDFEYTGKAKIKKGKVTIEPLSALTISSDFDSDSKYYMSLTVKSENSVNIMYRNPGGFVCIGQNGYVSSGTGGKWVERMFYKLSTGMNVTLYSTPTHITIWADGEKIVDSAYEKEGEACPAIAWTFDKQVEISDVKLWTTNKAGKKIQGSVEDTAKEKLSSEKTYSVGLQPEKTEDYSEKKVNTPKYNMAANVSGVASGVNQIEAEATMLPEVNLLPIVIGSIAVVILIIGLTILTIVLYKKENE